MTSEPGNKGRIIGSWWNALVTLRENPLARYYLLAQRRRITSVPWWQRWLSVILLVILLAIFLGYLWLWGGMPGSEVAEFISTIFYLLAIPVLAIWVVAGVYTAARDSMAVLGLGHKYTTSVVADDMLASSELSDAQIVVGVLWILLPPLWWRAWIGALVIWLFAFQYTIQSATEVSAVSYGQPSPAHSFVLAVLGVPPIAVAGMLAALVLILFLVTMGRSSTSLLGSVCGALTALAQAGWLIIGLILVTQGYYFFGAQYSYGTPVPAIAFMAWGIAFAVLAVLLCGFAARFGWLRPVLAIGMPLVLIIAGMASAVFVADLFGVHLSENIAGVAISLSGALAWCWSSMTVVNPLAIPSAACIGANLATGVQHVFLQPWLWGMLVAMQLVLLLFFAHFARISVHRRRVGC